MKDLTKLLFFASFLLMLNCNSSPQKKNTNNSNALKQKGIVNTLRNGFSIFELGSPIKNYSKSVKLVEEGEHKKSYEVIDTNLLNIKEGLKVDTITLSTWDGYIDYINVIVSDPYEENFRAMLINAYGIGNNNINDSIYSWYFKDPMLLVLYELNRYRTIKASASFARSIGKAEPNKELIDQSKNNINDI